MRDNGLGCGGWMLAIIGIVILWNVAGCVIGKIWDGTQEVLAERHAKQEVADARARERLARETAEKASAEARAEEARRVEAEAAEQRKREEAAQREAAERRAAAERREAVKMDKLRTFALQDAPAIQRVPGVGKKMASRIILELKDAFDASTAQNQDAFESSKQEVNASFTGALEALLSMGFTDTEASLALKGCPIDASEAILLQYALKRLGG